MKAPSERKEYLQKLGAFHPGIIIHTISSEKEFRMGIFKRWYTITTDYALVFCKNHAIF